MSLRGREGIVGAQVILLAALLVSALAGARLAAQDTTATYPRHLSYFPYLTVSPNDGTMGIARVVWFRQSRWDDRVSFHDQLAVEAGYSTRDAWLVRVRADAPQLAPGWRLQATAEAARQRNYFAADDRATRESGSVEVSRALGHHLLVALRGEGVHLTVDLTDPEIGAVPDITPSVSETDFRGRLALIYDARDREYDSRRGLLVQAGALSGSAGSGYAGLYGVFAFWIPVNERLRLTTREGFRYLDGFTVDAARFAPAWEDEFTVGGGPHSNRALPVGANTGRDVQFASAEARYDLKVFPGGAVALLAFVDGSRTSRDVAAAQPVQQLAAPADVGRWIVGAGGGLAVRLLRNAVLTATVGRAQHATRVYVSSGWSW